MVYVKKTMVEFHNFLSKNWIRNRKSPIIWDFLSAGTGSRDFFLKPSCSCHKDPGAGPGTAGGNHPGLDFCANRQQRVGYFSPPSLETSCGESFNGGLGEVRAISGDREHDEPWSGRFRTILLKNDGHCHNRRNASWGIKKTFICPAVPLPWFWGPPWWIFTREIAGPGANPGSFPVLLSWRTAWTQSSDWEAEPCRRRFVSLIVRMVLEKKIRFFSRVNRHFLPHRQRISGFFTCFTGVTLKNPKFLFFILTL